MRKYLLIVALLTFSFVHAQTWKDVGTPKFSTAVGINGLSAVSDSIGFPYIGYQQRPSGKMTVERFNGINWLTIGSPEFTTGSTDYNTMALDPQGYPYVAFTNHLLSTPNITVMKFDGSSWVYVGPISATTGGGEFSSIAIAKDGTPYFAYVGILSSSFIGVLKFDGTNWVHVGSPGFSGVDGYCPRIIMGKKDTPYVCFIKAPLPGDVAVMKFDGTNWIPVANVGGVAPGRANYWISIVTDSSGIPYIAYDDADNGSKATVKKYVGGKWQTVGAPGFSTADAGYISMTISRKQQLYVSYTDFSLGEKVTSMTFSNGSWTVIDNAGFSSGRAFSQIVVDTFGIPYVFYSDADDSYNGYIKRPDLAQITGVDTVCKGLDVTQTDIMSGGSWTSSNTVKATVSSAGKVTGVDTGSVTITYTVANMPVTHGIKVKDCRLEVAPINNLVVSVFPNPANDELNITGVDHSMNYHLLTLMGIYLLTGELHTGSNSISMSYFSPGVYFLEIMDSSGGKKVMRVVKD